MGRRTVVALMTAAMLVAATGGAALADSPWLGVRARPLKDSERAVIELTQKIGLRITAVEEKSPADAAGLQPGDIILAIGSTKVGTLAQVREVLSRGAPGDKVRFIYLRDGVLFDWHVTLGRKPEIEEDIEPDRPDGGGAEPDVPLDEEDIGPKVKAILGDETYSQLEELARNFGYRGKFTRPGLRAFFNRLGFDEDALKDNLKRMGVDKDDIDKLIRLLNEKSQSEKKLEKVWKHRWQGVFERGRVRGEFDLKIKHVDGLQNLEGRMTVEYGRVRLSSNVSGTLSSDGRTVTLRTHGTGGYWFFEGTLSENGKAVRGKFTTVGGFGAIRTGWGDFEMKRK